jgi:hypothetical protein
MKKFFQFMLVAAGILMVTAAVQADQAVTDNGAPKAAVQPGAATPAPPAKPKTAKKKAVKAKYIWVCPMGDFTGDKPGKCPHCGMDLVRQKVTDDKPAADKKM